MTQEAERFALHLEIPAILQRAGSQIAQRGKLPITLRVRDDGSLDLTFSHRLLGPETAEGETR